MQDWGNRITTYEYKADGALLYVVYPNGTKQYFSYDNAGRITGMGNVKSNNDTINAYIYELDSIGNHIRVTSKEPYNSPTIPIKNEIYTYDKANRIKTAGVKTFTFYKCGNMSRISDGGLNTDFTFDVKGRLTGIQKSGVTTTYTYDASGNRRQSVKGTNTVRYILDINSAMSQVLMETDGSGNVLNYYIYGVGLLYRIDKNGNVIYFHYDYRGSTIAMTDQSQNITHKYAYGPYGEIREKQEEDFNPYRYVGQWGVMDEENGLYFMRARYYMPEIKRFVSEDPVWGVNLYENAGGNPISLIDPMGTTEQTANSTPAIYQSPENYWLKYDSPLYKATGVAVNVAKTTQIVSGGAFVAVAAYITAPMWVPPVLLAGTTVGTAILANPDKASEIAMCGLKITLNAFDINDGLPPSDACDVAIFVGNKFFESLPKPIYPKPIKIDSYETIRSRNEHFISK